LYLNTTTTTKIKEDKETNKELLLKIDESCTTASESQLPKREHIDSCQRKRKKKKKHV
jgi:hypothetical protein